MRVAAFFFFLATAQVVASFFQTHENNAAAADRTAGYYVGAAVVLLVPATLGWLCWQKANRDRDRRRQAIDEEADGNARQPGDDRSLAVDEGDRHSGL